MRALWPTVTMRATPFERTVVIVHSINIDLPAHMDPVIPAYEERFLALVLSLLRQPGGRVVYVTSQPLLPRLVDYYFSMVPQLDGPDLRARFHSVSLSDGSPGRLTEKLLKRPGAIERIRALIPDPDRAFIVPFAVGEAERTLCCRLGIPVHGADPDLHWIGTKNGCRRIFAEEGVPHPAGVEGVRSLDDVVDGIEKIRVDRPGLQSVMVKLDDAASGLGNGVVDVRGATGRAALHERIRSIQLDDPDATPEEFLDSLDAQSGIVEERLTGTEVHSPSAQVRISPVGEVEVLATHDQVLGGATGQAFLGARFPAHPDYAQAISAQACTIGNRLAREGVLGRFGVDFVVTRDPGTAWSPAAIEINLRNGGTTHPLLTLTALADGEYDANANLFLAADGKPKFYVASDHMENDAYCRLTPDDVLDTIEQEGLTWNHETLTGYAFHLISAVAVAGRLGVTAIAGSSSEAEAMYERAARVFDEVAAR